MTEKARSSRLLPLHSSYLVKRPRFQGGKADRKAGSGSKSGQTPLGNQLAMSAACCALLRKDV